MTEAEQTFEEFNGGSIPKVEADPVVEKTPAVEPTKQLRPPSVMADEGGQLVGKSLEEEFRLAKAYFMSGLMPKGLNSPEKVLVAVQLCRELSLPPMLAIRQIMVFNGVPAIFGDLPVGLVLKSGKADYVDDSFEDKDGQPYAATCRTRRKGSPREVERRFTLDDARKAGLLSKEPWQKYPRRMLQCRARAWALKDAYADVLSGLSIAEYDFDTLPERELNEPSRRSGSDKLNEILGKAKTVNAVQQQGVGDERSFGRENGHTGNSSQAHDLGAGGPGAEVGPTEL